MNTKHWRPGDRVSRTRMGDLTIGTVIELRRRLDGKPFLMVEQDGGSTPGQRSWPNEGWILGAGPHLLTCLECGDDFRADDHQQEFCTACLKGQRPAYDVQAGGPNPRQVLHATWSSKHKQEPTPPTRKDDDDFGSPF